MDLYLYGKKRFLGELISGSKGIRLSDIAHYSVMENELMRDNELRKKFVLNKNKYKLEINGMVIGPGEMADHPTLEFGPDRCFCVCFSTKQNDPDLFKRFEADVCIEINLEKLLEVLQPAATKFEGMKVVHGKVIYYPDVMSDPIPTLESVLFYKRDVYSVESEYRVALTIPPHRKKFSSVEGVVIDIFSDDPKDLHHLFINGTSPEINKHYVTRVFHH